LFQERIVAPMKHISIPVFSINDVRTFIREGVDPLSNHLLQEKQREDEWFAEKEFSASHRKENMVRRGMMLATKKLTNRADQPRSSACFLLMHSLSELDLLDCIMAFSLKSMRARWVVNASSRSSNNSSNAPDTSAKQLLSKQLFSKQLFSAIPPQTNSETIDTSITISTDKIIYSPSRPSVIIPSSRRGTNLRGPSSRKSIVDRKSLLQSPESGLQQFGRSQDHSTGRRQESFFIQQPSLPPAIGKNNFRGNKTRETTFTASTSNHTSHLAGNC